MQEIVDLVARLGDTLTKEVAILDGLGQVHQQISLSLARLHQHLANRINVVTNIQHAQLSL
jgi:hypothetical protein